MIYALAGNQNSGKTTLFNQLTGSNQHVGNFPGVTVDSKMGEIRGEKGNAVVDLPGIYSIRPYTNEEIVTRSFILQEKPDGIINIVDATNIERNLYLTLQLLELHIPMVVALNMMDEVEKSGDKNDAKELEKQLGVPVVAISALKGKGIKELMDKAAALPKTRKGSTTLKAALGASLETAVAYYEGEGVKSPLFHAVKLLENDEIEVKRKGADKVLSGVNIDDTEALVADERYKYISANLAKVKVKSQKGETLTKSD
ncbi:MAG: 50S ribosome-binding GTPase, partial [Lachnospiraceae bacterium]|nr:50S ribosome-binding GTPase [Lachnospiraceae bacterium]